MDNDFQNWKQPFKDIGITPYISQFDTQHKQPHIHLDYSGEHIVLHLPSLDTFCRFTQKK